MITGQENSIPLGLFTKNAYTKIPWSIIEISHENTYLSQATECCLKILFILSISWIKSLSQFCHLFASLFPFGGKRSDVSCRGWNIKGEEYYTGAIFTLIIPILCFLLCRWLGLECYATDFWWKGTTRTTFLSYFLNITILSKHYVYIFSLHILEKWQWDWAGQ